MISRLTILILTLLPPLTAADTPFAGTWEGKTNGLPAVELIVRQEAGKITGSIGFYFQIRGEDGKWRLGEKTSLPVLRPVINGNVLTFESIHRKQHGGTELGPNNRYHVNLAGANEMRLNILKDGTPVNGTSGLKLARQK